jgi:hypothetical protein
VECIANGVAFLIPGSLSEYTSQLGFARVCRLPVHLSLASGGLLLHDRHPGAVHLHVEDGYWVADHDGQVQLDSALDLVLFSPGDIAADGLRCALHRLVVTSKPASTFICSRP